VKAAGGNPGPPTKDAKQMSETGVAKILSDLQDARRLLALARCPDEHCDNAGSIAVFDTHGDVVAQQCQWCYEKSLALGQESRGRDGQ
jgi:NAD-dependent SIR2 family protein deacetylase